ncbi:TetR family transcriptional regulator [Secundilactobacillus hailunensis]|uniref:TetR family transcriptional regulator n=1 Tax=Secundilactobacillus hailunensis TaxID=2559923 RepID=UPI0010F56283|nr:TetR family transcriptional regulator [Secundilactobacillus hailunensis]
MTDLRVLKTKRAIQDAFVDLVLTEGFERVTVSGLARRAMINRQTFYTHYLDKYDLAEKLSQKVVAGFGDIAQLRIQLIQQELTVIQIVDRLRPGLTALIKNYRRPILALRTIHLNDFDLTQQITDQVKKATSQMLGESASPFELAVVSGVVNSVFNYLLEYNSLPTDEEIAEGLTRIKDFFK